MTYEDICKKWYESTNKSFNDVALSLESFCIGYAYNSGKIENANITYNDTRQIFHKDGVVSYTGDLRTLYEMKNSKDAWDYLLEILEQRLSLEEGVLKRFHKLLTKNTYDERRWKAGERPGEYKKHDYVTGILEVGVAPEDVAEEIGELLDELKDFDDKKIIVAAAYFHAKFENIHAFADGNGRTGRIAMNYLLLLYGHPPVTIYDEDKRDYYEALVAWDREQSLDELIAFMKNQTVKTWENIFEKKNNSTGKRLGDYM